MRIILRLLALLAMCLGLSLWNESALASFSLDVGRERPSHFFSGEGFRQMIRITNNFETPQDAVVRWETVVSPAVIQKGELEAKLLPGKTKELIIDLQMPEVKRRIELVWKISVFSDGDLSEEKTVKYSVFPREIPFSLNRTISRKKVGIYDPQGAIKSVFRELGWDFVELESQLSIRSFDGSLLIVNLNTGKKDFVVKMKEPGLVSPDMVHGGMNVLYFNYIFPADVLYLGAHKWLVKATQILSPGHPVFHSLSEDDLKWWRGDGFVAKSYFVKPKTGNFRILAEEKQEHEVLLVEFLSGREKHVFCGFSIIEKFTKEPVARIFLANVIRYALSEVEPLQEAIIFGEPESPIVEFLHELGIGEANDSDALSTYNVAILSFEKGSIDYLVRKNQRFFITLKEFVRNGGILLVFGLEPESAMYLKRLVPVEISFPKIDWDGILRFDRTYPLLWGISKYELQSLLASEDSFYPLRFREGKDAKALTQPCAIGEFRIGKGKIVICQIKFWGKGEEEISLRTISQLLTNLGIQLGKQVDSEMLIEKTGGVILEEVLG